MPVSLKHHTLFNGADRLDWETYNEDHDLTLSGQRLLGRYLAGNGLAQEITLGDGLTLGGDGILSADAGFSGSYNDLTDKPTLFSGAYADLTGIPSTFAPSAHQHSAADITSGTLDIARIPVLPSTVQVVSSGGIANLSAPQQAEIGDGSVVTTTDGRRWVYTGTGSKTAEASYIELADITPEWSVISNKPATFTPSTHGHVAADISDFNTAVRTNRLDQMAAPTAAVGFNSQSLTGAGSLQLGASSDLKLERDAANTLALRNEASAQAFRVYNTYTDAANYERGFMRWSSNVLEIGTEAGGTGSQRQIAFRGQGGGLAFTTVSNGSMSFTMTGNGSLGFNSDSGTILFTKTNTSSTAMQTVATFNHGSNQLFFKSQLVTATDHEFFIEMRSAYIRRFKIGPNQPAGGQIGCDTYLFSSPAASNATVQRAGDLYLFAPAAGAGTGRAGNVVLQHDGTAATPGLVTFGGLTNTAPALKRSGTELQVRLADDSGYASFSAATLKLNTDVVLERDAADILALMRGTNPQNLNIYKTRSGSDYERFRLGWNGDEFLVESQVGGNGIHRNVKVISSLGTGAGSLQIINNANAAYTAAFAAHTPNITVGNRSLFSFGKINTAKNEAQVAFYYDGDGSNSNRMEWGFNTVASVFNIYADGRIALGGTDVVLNRDAANTLALRNGTSAQLFHIYNTSSSNNTIYERGFLKWESNFFRLGTETVGGSARGMVFASGGDIYYDSTNVYWRDNAGSSIRWVIASSALYPGADNTIDIGISAQRIREIHIGSNIRWGTTNASPALKRSSTELQVRLADDSAFAPLSASLFKLPTTTSTVGQLQINGNRFVHAYGTRNAFFGENSGNFTLTGTDNVALGNGATTLLTTGSNNLAVGTGTLQKTSTGEQNVAVGSYSLQENTGGSSNTAIGGSTLNKNSGSHNIAIGFATIGNKLSGDGNTAIGSLSGLSITSSAYNVLLGYGSGQNMLTGSRNILIGPSTVSASSGQITSGSRNISIGDDVAVASTTANDQLSIGNLIYGTALDGTGATISTGKIGIGVKAPAEKLDVNGAVRATTATFTALPTTDPNYVGKLWNDNGTVKISAGPTLQAITLS